MYRYISKEGREGEEYSGNKTECSKDKRECEFE